MTQEEFAEAVHACQEQLFRMAYLYLRNYQDCQDAVQEALMRAWRARRSLKRPEYFETWLIRILLNVMKDFARRAARHPVAPLEGDVRACPEPPDPDLRDAIRALDARLRAPLLLRCVAGYSVGETARLLGITTAQVRWRLERARKQLRAQLKTDEEAIL